MSLEIKVPTLGESVSEASIAKWYKNIGDSVKTDETIVELETDKVTLEVSAAADGVISEIRFKEGSSVVVGDILGIIEAGAQATTSSKAITTQILDAKKPTISPAPQRIITENNLNTENIHGSGKGGRITKGDALAAISATSSSSDDKPVERVRMSKLRQRIAQRLKESQNTAAILTTFNEVDMSAIIALRNQYKDGFEKKYGVKLGFMSFFVKAAIAALKEIPSINAEIDGDEILYKNYYDIGVAVGTPQGLVVPVVRAASELSFAGIEQNIFDLGAKARDGKLTSDDLSGGTFTVSNGGVYGSLMSTPIINPPQSAILGMHKTMDRPIAVNGKVEIRPMMYLALSYDHRIIDGKEAVTFLVRVKEAIEDPQRLLLGV